MIAETNDHLFTFTKFVKRWFRLLSVEAFSDALSRIDEPNSCGNRWTKEQILAVLRDYANTNVVSVSDPDALDEGGRPNLVEFSDGSGFYFEHDVPINGHWSDLTAQFEFLRRPAGFAVVLHDIHVL